MDTMLREAQRITATTGDYSYEDRLRERLGLPEIPFEVKVFRDISNLEIKEHGETIVFTFQYPEKYSGELMLSLMTGRYHANNELGLYQSLGTGEKFTMRETQPKIYDCVYEFNYGEKTHSEKFRFINQLYIKKMLDSQNYEPRFIQDEDYQDWLEW